MIKTQEPHVTQVYLRSNEASCCDNSSLIAAAKDIGQRVGTTNRLSLRLLRATVRQGCMRANLVSDKDMHLTVLQRRS